MQPTFEVGEVYRAKRGKKEYRILDVGGKDTPYYTVEELGSGKRFDQYETALLKTLRPPLKPGERKDQVFLSASQLNTFRRCKRKWAFRYIDGIEAPSSPAQEFGTLVHSTIEDYLLTGKEFPDNDLGKTAQQGKHALPDPSKHLLVEHEFKFKVLDGRGVFVGFIDLVVPPDHKKGQPLEVIDHKTTKDLRYAMKPGDLEEDVQANIYAKYGMTSYLVDTCVTRWLYYCARPNRDASDGRPRIPRGFREVPRIKSLKEVDTQWEGILKDADQMVQIRTTAKSAGEVEPNPLACGDFGGCPYSGVCKLPKGTALEQLFQHGRIAHLGKRHNQKGQKGMSSLIDVIRQGQGKAQEEVKTATPEVSKGAEGINPPPRNKITPEEAGKLAAEKGAQEAAEPPKKKRTRKPRTTKKDNGNGTTTTTGMTGLAIAVDIYPVKWPWSQVTTLAEYTKDLKTKIQEETELPHWNLVQYRQGEVMLAALLKDKLQSEKPALLILCDGRSDEWKACCSTLTEYAETVFQ